VRAEQLKLGKCVRSLLADNGFKSVAAEDFGAPGVVVCYTDDDGVRSGKKFADAGLQIATGVPLQCDEPDDFKSFRVELFGRDKLHDVEGAVARLAKVLDSIC
jgi:aspartate aminotransferase-like enzyme